MHILYVSQYFPPEPGAPAARVSELATAWVRAGHQVTVLTGMPNHPVGVVPLAYRGRAVVHEDFHGVHVVRTWIFAAANRGRVRRSLAYASFAVSAVVIGQLGIGRPDVIVATSPQLLCAAAGCFIAAPRQVPWVFEVRDLWPESVVTVGALGPGHPVIRVLTAVEEALYRNADAVVVVTDGFRSKLLARGVSTHKVAVVKNGVDLGRFKPAPRTTDLRARLGWGDRFVAAYVGTHGMAHGLGAILDVATRLLSDDRFRFLFAGAGAEAEALRARVARESLTNVTFLGLLPRDGINEVYATADACLVPLRRAELFTTTIPSKIFEILAMERPIIISVDGEARSIVEAAGAGLFAPPEDVGAITRALLELADDSERAAAMGRSGRAYVTANFDRDFLARRYLDVLLDVTRQHGSTRSFRSAPADPSVGSLPASERALP